MLLYTMYITVYCIYYCMLCALLYVKHIIYCILHIILLICKLCLFKMTQRDVYGGKSTSTSVDTVRVRSTLDMTIQFIWRRCIHTSQSKSYIRVISVTSLLTSCFCTTCTKTSTRRRAPTHANCVISLWPTEYSGYCIKRGAKSCKGTLKNLVCVILI